MLLLTCGLSAEEVASESPPEPLVTQEYKELAGTVVLTERILPVFKSGGEEYLLLVRPEEPGAQDIRNGMAIIVKGIVKTIVEKGQPTRLLLRPSEVTIKGQTVKFKDLDEVTQDPQEW
jgi:hypothetical protein